MTKRSVWPDGMGIYSITNIVNGRVYIGQGSFGRRWPVHTRLLNQGKHHNRALQADWLAFGVDAFEFKVLHVATREFLRAHRALDDIEQSYIRAQENPYNADWNTKWRLGRNR